MKRHRVEFFQIACSKAALPDGVDVQVFGVDYDLNYELTKSDAWEEARDPGAPQPLGPEGLLYYAAFSLDVSPGFETIQEAKNTRKRVSVLNWYGVRLRRLNLLEAERPHPTQ